MNAMQEATAVPVHMSKEERDEIREQLNRMLETHHFRNSRRYPALLRFIVEEALEGRGEFLKERLLGVRVFDRPADYDTATDPVVRVTIAEIRKRIAQYYHDEEHDAEIRIELMPGRYAPEFRTRSVRKESTAEAATLPHPLEPVAPSVANAEEPALVHPVAGRPRRGLWLAASVGTVVLLLLGSLMLVLLLRQSALKQLWAPLLATQHTILFCVPTDVGTTIDAAGDPDPLATASRRGKNTDRTETTFRNHEALGENVVFSDMLAALRIANVLTAQRQDYRARLNISTTLEDLRQGPAVLIGGLDNQWTMRALAPLRFRFAGSDADRYWIYDAKNPEDRSWSLDLKLQYAAVTRDYAIVARLHNEQTGEPEMIVAGIGMSGTAAAGEFIGSEQGAEALERRIGRGFKDRDFEAVLSSDVVNGIAGDPKIVAVTVW
jgi:hypothetical protein